MSKLYKLKKLTEETHKLVQELAKQEGVEVKLMNVWWVSDCGIRHCIDQNTGDLQELSRSDYQPLLEAPQIRQILKAFEGVLGENPEITKNNAQILKCKDDNDFLSASHLKILRKENERLIKNTPTFVQALCQKWLDGLDPMIDSEPEKVLIELNEILKSKINYS